MKTGLGAQECVGDKRINPLVTKKLMNERTRNDVALCKRNCNSLSTTSE